ncbi:agamous-like MADS-box protein AGL82 [Impatiens glandulifera]|uniref:agamous-like MADS-box protein AGL82 n=1 Tax=Impatiens glandulifera TaxID=253017 RepID=UPI001FB0D1B0|nr:agamous-like MADS-box protein AGL82 [Impatiens glandulifera]
MGRAKLNMHLISGEKSRLTTFQKRKKGLIKKAYELQTLCSVDVCLIIYHPETCESLSKHPEIWPSDSEKVGRMIESYNRQPIDDQKRRTNDLLFYFEDRNKKVEDALVKLRKKNNEILYPTWGERYANYSEDELRNIASVLQTKFDEVRVKVNMMKNIDENNDLQLGFLPQDQSSPYLINEAMLGFFRDSLNSMNYMTPQPMMLSNNNNNNDYYGQSFCNQTDNFSPTYSYTNPQTIPYPMVSPDVYCSPLGYPGPTMPQTLETSFMPCGSFQGYNMEFAPPINNNGYSNVMNGFYYGSSSNGSRFQN